MPIVMPIRTPKLGKYIFPIWFLAEIAMFIIVGKTIGVLLTLLLIIATAMLGFNVLRAQGSLAVWQMDQQLRQHPNPADMLSATSQIFAGLLLIIPGFITDFMGLLLLIPACRTYLCQWLQGRGMVKTPANDEALEGEYWQTDEQSAADSERERINKP